MGREEGKHIQERRGGVRTVRLDTQKYYMFRSTLGGPRGQEGKVWIRKLERPGQIMQIHRFF